MAEIVVDVANEVLENVGASWRYIWLRSGEHAIRYALVPNDMSEAIAATLGDWVRLA